MYKLDEEGFLVRDNQGRKISYIYADTREEIHSSKEECYKGTPDGGCWTLELEEGSFDIIDVGPIQYNHQGFKTEPLCGSRVHWRHAVVLGKPRRPTKWNTRANLIARS